MRKDKKILLNGIKIMVVDDEQGIIDALINVFEKNGYQTFGYTDHNNALLMLKNNHFDILILDYFLDGINGRDFLGLMKSKNSNLQKILLTGFKDTLPPIVTINSLEIDDYCEKSDTFDELLLRVEVAKKRIKETEETEDFSKIFSRLMDQNDIDPSHIAKFIGTTRAQISQYKSGKNRPQYERLILIATYFGVTTDYLLGFDYKKAINQKKQSDLKNNFLQNPIA